MTAVNLLLNLKSMLESEFERLALTSRNKEVEKQLLKADSVINIDKNAYSKILIKMLILNLMYILVIALLL